MLARIGLGFSPDTQTHTNTRFRPGDMVFFAPDNHGTVATKPSFPTPRTEGHGFSRATNPPQQCGFSRRDISSVAMATFLGWLLPLDKSGPLPKKNHFVRQADLGIGTIIRINIKRLSENPWVQGPTIKYSITSIVVVVGLLLYPGAVA